MELAPKTILIIWLLFVLAAGGLIAFLVIRLLWKRNYPKKPTH